MTTILVPTRSVHGSAAACDYLAGRGDVETVVGVGVAPPDDPEAARDAGQALNVLAVRLPRLDVETEQWSGDGGDGGDVADVVLAAADDHGVDEVVVAEGFDGVDDLVADAGVPVVVVPDVAADG